MKKVIYLLGLLLILGVSSSFTNVDSQISIDNDVRFEISTCKHGQCHAITKSTDKRCKHCVSNTGDKYCWQHK